MQAITEERKVVLAPECGPERTEAEMVDDAVEHISAVLRRTVVKGMIEVGEYVLDRFFSGDTSLLHSRCPKKTVSFRMLAKRCGTAQMPISATWLYNAVCIAARRRALPPNAAYLALSPSHQAALLVVREPAEAERLAHQVIENGLSIRKLQRMLREDGKKALARPGPKRVRCERIVEELQRVLETLSLNRAKISMDHIEGLSEADAESLSEAVRCAISHLDELLEKLDAREPAMALSQALLAAERK
jgi:hypothetical protein